MLYVTHKWAKVPTEAITIDTTAKNGIWSQLSPFLLPGGELYDDHIASNMENAWQFAKLYKQHATFDGHPTQEYWEWATKGWADPKAHRYPMGKGARPLHSWWKWEALGYITARKRIYAPLYARAVMMTEAFAKLQEMLTVESRDIYLRDWDGYNHLALKQTIDQVVNNPAKKMGHAFVLWALLTGQFEKMIRE